MIHLILTLQSPFIISENRIENLLKSSDYISGSSLRGALASVFLKSNHKNNRDLFRDLFLSGTVHFGNCYLGTDKVSVITATARSCKNFSGFLPEKLDKEEPKHGVLDGLIRYYAYQKSLHQNSKKKKCLEHLDECKKCGSQVEYFSGVYGEIGDKYKRFEPKKTVITRTAIDENTLTAKEGSLFSTEVVLPPETGIGYYFHGRIFSSDSALEETLKDFLSNISFSIGGERTYGYGRIEVTEAKIISGSSFLDQDTETRLGNFNNKLQEFLPHEKELFFALTLNSDAILVDSFLRFVSPLNESILYEYFPTDIKFTLLESYCSTRIIKGWSNIHKLPKENDIALTMGSAFLFKAEEGTDKQELIEYLTNIENKGIGERKTEGFGKLVVCHPFHLEVNPI